MRRRLEEQSCQRRQIGLQMITTRTEPSPRTSPPPRDRDSENAALTAEAVTRQSPPPPGMGKLVDKTA
jgi:hypothetical protein